VSNEQQRQLVATPEEAVANLKARLSDHPEPTPESVTDELAAIEAAHGNCTDGCVVPTLLAALHAEQEARARVEAAARALSDFLYDGIGWIERGPSGMSVADAERLNDLGDALRAALAPDASEGEPTDG
jgi:hypothetical protein